MANASSAIARSRILEALRIMGSATATQLREHTKMANDTVHRALSDLAEAGVIIRGRGRGGALPYRLANPTEREDGSILEVRPSGDLERLRRLADPLCQRGCSGNGYTQTKEFNYERVSCVCTRDANAGARPPVRMAVRHMSARVNPMEAA